MMKYLFTMTVLAVVMSSATVYSSYNALSDKQLTEQLVAHELIAQNEMPESN